jgi:DNA-directed RNA polymerase specialized sigma24 family protein
VARAGAQDKENRIAFESLYRIYSHPVYAFIRRRGHSRHEAQDLTQDFFVHLLQKNIPDKADPLRGKFRTFLLTALEFFLALGNSTSLKRAIPFEDEDDDEYEDD